MNVKIIFPSSRSKKKAINTIFSHFLWLRVIIFVELWKYPINGTLSLEVIDAWIYNMTPVYVKLINQTNRREKPRQLPCYPDLRTTCAYIARYIVVWNHCYSLKHIELVLIQTVNILIVQWEERRAREKKRKNQSCWTCPVSMYIYVCMYVCVHAMA